jgi:hypothetical protein
VTQPLGPGWLILMLLAAMAPMLLAVPSAVMHWPTFSADAWAVTTFRYLVEAVMLTVMLVPAPAWARSLPSTTKPLADSEVTLPFAPPNPPNAPRLPVGRGLGLKLDPGRGEKVPRGPPNPPPPPPPKPKPDAAVQLPLTGVLTVTVVAVTDLLADPLLAGVPTTETQLPTVTSLDVTATVSVIGVAAVKVTVTCPLVGFCTSMLAADTAAAVPTTPGKAAWLLAGVGLTLAAAAEGVGVAFPPLAQAVAASATPRQASAGVQRRQVRPAADMCLVVAPIMCGLTSL